MSGPLRRSRRVARAFAGGHALPRPGRRRRELRRRLLAAALALSASSATAGTLPALSAVSHWFYFIDVNLGSEVVDQVVASGYDLVVIDFIPSEANNTDYPIANVVSALRGAAHPKRVLAYIDIGQAEDFRTYWQPGWGIGNPEWITALDPDGWEGNYPVAYWYDEWHEIWLGREGSAGYLQGILDAGFDGVYLDWVEAYSDPNVGAAAAAQELDARQEMIWWVADIAAFGRSRKPDFLVIGQNAAELAAFPEYVAAVDAIAQEQVWFDGAADDDPPGDCPLPATDDDVDTQAYFDSLSPACQQLYIDFPESTLHVSSASYIADLLAAQAQGLPIFTVDYAVQPAHIATAHRNARALGFVPFASNRALDQFVEPVPVPAPGRVGDLAAAVALFALACVPSAARLLATPMAAAPAIRSALVAKLGRIRSRSRGHDGAREFHLDFRPIGRVWSNRGIRISDEGTAAAARKDSRAGC